MATPTIGIAAVRTLGRVLVQGNAPASVRQAVDLETLSAVIGTGPIAKEERRGTKRQRQSEDSCFQESRNNDDGGWGVRP